MANRKKHNYKLPSINVCKDGRMSTKLNIKGKTKPVKSRKNETEKEFKERLVELLDNATKNDLDPFMANVKFKVWGEKWFVDKKLNKIDSKTYKDYYGTYTRDILPFFGNMPISKISDAHIQEFANYLVKKGFVVGCIKRTMSTVLNGIITYARKNKLTTLVVEYEISQNVTPSKEVMGLSYVEQEIFINAIKNDYYYAYYMTMLLSGLRTTETSALRRENVDLENNLIYVRESVNENAIISEYGIPTGHNEVMVKQGGKTKNAIREVVIISQLKDILIAQYDKIDKLIANGTLQKTDLVFPNRNSNYYLSTRNYNFDRIIKKANLPNRLTPYCLRHTYAINNIYANVNIYVLSRSMGHSSIKVTLDTYGSYMPQQASEEVKKVELLPHIASLLST